MSGEIRPVMSVPIAIAVGRWQREDAFFEKLGAFDGKTHMGTPFSARSMSSAVLTIFRFCSAMCALTRAISFSSQDTVSPAFGAPFCLKPRGVTVIHGRSPMRDQATSVALPAAMFLASGCEE